MVYQWFKIFNRAEFLALDLTSKTYTLLLEGIGTKDFLVTNGVSVGVTYEDIFLAVELNDENPFEFADHAIYIDASEDVYFGFLVEEES